MKAVSKNMVASAKTFLQDEEAATAAEYGILAALVAVAIITAVTTFGTKLTTTFNTMSGKLPTG
jgi:pilus assembly protein Flp/PilA